MNDPATPTARALPAVAHALVSAMAPVLDVEPGHVAEARRALRAQGKAPCDDGVLRLLWVARALPTALDVLADARSEPGLGDVSFLDVEVDVPSDHDDPAQPGAELFALGRLEASSPAEVVVLIGDRRALLDAESDLATPRCSVRFRLASTLGLDDTHPGVQLHRFTLSRSV